MNQWELPKGAVVKFDLDVNEDPNAPDTKELIFRGQDGMYGKWETSPEAYYSPALFKGTFVENFDGTFSFRG